MGLFMLPNSIAHDRAEQDRQSELFCIAALPVLQASQAMHHTSRLAPVIRTVTPPTQHKLCQPEASLLSFCHINLELTENELCSAQ